MYLFIHKILEKKINMNSIEANQSKRKERGGFLGLYPEGPYLGEGTPEEDRRGGRGDQLENITVEWLKKNYSNFLPYFGDSKSLYFPYLFGVYEYLL